MAAAVYTVTTPLSSAQYQVSQDEYERLQDLGLVASLVGVTTTPDRVVISSTVPTSPAVGTVWFNLSS